MRRKQNIQDTFKSIVPELTAGNYSVGYSGHTDISGTLIGSGVTITAIRAITGYTEVVTGNPITNDVWIDYTYLDGGVTPASGTTSIYSYPPITTTTTTVATTTTTTIAPTTTTTTT